VIPQAFSLFFSELKMGKRNELLILKRNLLNIVKIFGSFILRMSIIKKLKKPDKGTSYQVLFSNLWRCGELNPGPKWHIVQVSTCVFAVLSFA